MAEAHLGPTIDIHGGGADLQFPHHENEVAQSECAHGGAPFARFWLHNGMLNFGGAKMAKSVGNIQRVHDLVRQHPPEALRYALLSAHYRQPLEWSDGLIRAVRAHAGPAVRHRDLAESGRRRDPGQHQRSMMTSTRRRHCPESRGIARACRANSAAERPG
jgi:cysteinyl-tRNA synthetase